MARVKHKSWTTVQQAAPAATAAATATPDTPHAKTGCCTLPMLLLPAGVPMLALV
jgi:hypothetical protein